MKIIITSFLLGISFLASSQSKEFVIVDDISKKPIDLAQISYPSLGIGSISNMDGKIKLPLKEKKIIISHINYIEKEFSFNDFKKMDTLFLVSKTNQLEEVILYNLNLKQKLTDILENSYLNKYSTEKIIHNSTYKETFSVNDSLTRLFQVQLDWFSKNSLFKTNIAADKQNIINLESIDYSKIKKIDNDFISSNGAYIENKDLFRFAHLNFLLSILVNLTEDYEIENIQKNGITNSVYFNATLIENGKKLYNHKNSLIVFDKDFKSIKHLKFNMDYSSNFDDAISNNHKKPFKRKTKSHTIELSFKKLINNKYSISYFISELKGVVKTKKFTDNISSKQSLFISKSRLGKKLRRGNIDFDKPFYNSISKNLKKNGVKILLTEKEKYFLK